MDSKIVLRPINHNDLEWIRLLRNRNRKYFFDRRIIAIEQQKKWYQKLDYPFFIIECDGNPAGTIGLRKLHGVHEIHNVLIDEQFRRKGILKYAIGWLIKQYGAPMYIDVLNKNKSAVNAYKKIGFLPVSLRMKINDK